jgi:DNA-binding MarR family transcriptional regulator
MAKPENQDKEAAIKEILRVVEQIPRMFASPDLDEWRHLNVPMAQLKSLFLITNRKETNSRTLAEELDVTPGNVTGIVDRLAEQELVIRKPDPQDRRVIWLEATPKGKELLNKLMENHSKQFAMILGFMRVEDINSLSTGLKALLTAVEAHMEELKITK